MTDRTPLVFDSGGNITQLQTGDSLVVGVGTANIKITTTMVEPSSSSSPTDVCSLTLISGLYDVEFMCNYGGTSSSSAGMKIGYEWTGGNAYDPDMVAMIQTASNTISWFKVKSGLVTSNIATVGGTDNYPIFLKGLIGVTSTTTFKIIAQLINANAVTIVNGYLKCTKL